MFQLEEQRNELLKQLCLVAIPRGAAIPSKLVQETPFHDASKNDCFGSEVSKMPQNGLSSAIGDVALTAQAHDRKISLAVSQDSVINQSI